MPPLNEQNLVTKGPLKTDPAPVHRDEVPKAGEIEMKIDGANKSPDKRQYDTGEGVYDVPGASSPRQPNIVDGGARPKGHSMPRTKTVYLEGGPRDGEWEEVATGQMVAPVLVEVDLSNEPPFQFDEVAHKLYVRTKGREGNPNLTRGTHEMVNYRFKGQNTAEGHQIFSYVEPELVPA